MAFAETLTADRTTHPESVAPAEQLPSRPRWGPLLAISLIVLAGTAVYWNSFAGVFVFDDFSSIVDNPTIRQWWCLDQVVHPPYNLGETVAGRPLVNFSLAVNYAISGTEIWSYHLVNLVLHLFNAALLFELLRRTFDRPVVPLSVRYFALWLALVIAGLWTVHPLQTEAVTYIVERAESLVALFYLLTLYCVLRSVESTRPTWWKVGAVVACALGMASKEIMVTAPVMVLVYDRTFLAGSYGQAWRRRWDLYLGLAATWRLLGGLVISAGLIFRGPEFDVLSRWPYALSQPQAILHYLRLAVWPYPQCAYYAWPVSGSWQEIWPFLAVVVVCGIVTLWALARHPMWGFLGMWFFGILAPTSSIIPLRDVIVERRMYLPLVAVLTLLVLACFAVGRVMVRRGWLPGRTAGRLGLCLVMVLAATWGFLTVQRNRVYSSEFAMWEDTVEKAPHNTRAQNNLGMELASAGRLVEAIEHYQEAIRLKPDHAIAHNNLANALADSQRLPEAIEHYEKAVRLKPDYAKAHNNLANALTKVGRPSEAVEHYQAVLRTQPNDPLAHSNLAGVLMNLGSLAEAVEHYQQALKLDPQSAETRNNLAVALLKSDRLPEAIDQFQQAARLNPELVDVQYNLGKALAKAGRIREAIEHGRKAIRLAPDQARVYRFVAWLMATHESADGGNPEQAVELAERACILTDRRDPTCLDTLAAAYASAGRFDEAVATSSKAWQLAEEAGQTSLTEDIHVRLQLYRERKSYRELHEESSGRRF